MLSRRATLKGLATAPLVTPLAGPSAASAKPAPEADATWRNWSGLQSARPERFERPRNTQALADLIHTTSGTLRPVGASHSFTPLMGTDGTMVAMDHFQGLIDHDPDQQLATLGGGTRLNPAANLLNTVGQAFPNMPDIGQQTLAGALATATHGTGATLGCMNAYTESFELVTANGDRLRCSPQQNADLFHAASVGLGAFGFLTQVTLHNQPSYRLARKLEWRSIQDILSHVETLAEQHRNLEFFYVPFTGMGMMDRQDITDDPIGGSAGEDQNEGLETLRNVRDWLSWSSWLRERVVGLYLSTQPTETSVAPAAESYTHVRKVLFNEMEYLLPRAVGLKAFEEVRQRLERDFPEVFFPMEVRFVKGDDLWLSPFYQQDSIAIAVHREANADHRPLFQALEPILRKHGGRPHWGKLHNLGPKDLEALYPRWQEAMAIRRELDPAGRLLNPYLQRLLGVEPNV
ncbi:D-arabinono-1,4-lactone oxidase [Halomonadaceae bacterium KBTZ08]